MVPPQSSPTAPNPPLLAALLCDTAMVDRSNGKKSLLGIFDTIYVREFSVARVFSLSCKIVRNEGPYQFLLTLVSRETAPVRGTGTGHATIGGRLRAPDYPLDLPPVQAPEAARYEFQISVNNQVLGTTTPDIRLFPAGSRKEKV
jgi:hypothetical protein